MLAIDIDRNSLNTYRKKKKKKKKKKSQRYKYNMKDCE